MFKTAVGVLFHSLLLRLLLTALVAFGASALPAAHAADSVNPGPPPRAHSQQPRGSLVIVGGALRSDNDAVWDRIVELAGGLENVSTLNETPIPGAVIHEMGTARMGADPKQSVVNRFNQLHDAPNVFVTDGACMTSTACQNPSLTYMALTARAATYAIEELKAGRL